MGISEADYQQLLRNLTGGLESPAKQKYHAQPKEVDGIRFASSREAEYYRQLKVAEHAGVIRDLELQPRFKMECGIEYRADFRFTDQQGKSHVVDVKGMETTAFKLKMKLMAYFRPDVNVEIWR